MNDPDLTPDDDWNGTRADRLISRIVDRRAEPQDWSSFTALAHSEPAHWEQLLTTLRADVALRAALAGVLETAETVETPLPSLSRWRQLRPWTGWAAAGLLALAWAGASRFDLQRQASPASPLAQPAAPSNVARTATDAPLWNTNAPVVEELPLRLMGARPGPAGRGIEVLYVRPVVERAVVDGVYSVGTDELGRPAPVQIDPATLVASNNL
jgi:hypothetical protein